MKHYEEDGRLFQTATNSITVIVQARNSREGITEEVVGDCVKALQVMEKNFSIAQQQTAGAAIVVSARVVLPKTTINEKLALIPLFRQALDMISSFDKLSAFQWTNIQPLFHMYMENIPGDSPSATKVLNLLLKIFDLLKVSPNVNDDFFSYHSCLSIARIIHNTVPIVSNRDKDVELCKLALEVLSRIIRQCPPKKAPSVSLFVSGLLGRLVTFLKTSGINSSLLENCLLLITEAVILVFADEAVKFNIKDIDLNDYRKEMHCIFLNQTTEWRSAGAEHIVQYINEIVTRYLVHRVFPVREAACNLVVDIQAACPTLLGEMLYDHLLFMYKLMRYDDWAQFQVIASKCVNLITNKQKAQTYFYENLEFHIQRLPVRTRSDDGTREVNAICAILDGIGDGVRLMCTTGSETIELLLRSLADSIIVNKKRIMITSDSAAENCEQALRKMKVMHDIKHGTIKQVCEIMAKLGGIEIVDIVHNLMRTESIGKKSSYHIILGYLLSSLDIDKMDSDDPIILMLVEYLVKETNKLCVIHVMDQSKPVTTRHEIDWETCVESLSLTNVALCMKFIGGTANRSNISINSLCTILMQTTSTSWIVGESAQFALRILTEQDNTATSVNELIEIYSSHILNQVSLACSSSTDYHMAPILLKGYLKHAKVTKQFDVIRVIVEKMLFAIDNNEQRYTYSLLQAIMLFMESLVEEFPNQQPLPPPEDSEDEKPLPTPQHVIAEKILLRTKHMLTSEYLPVQVTVLKIVPLGISLLANYDDMLLPMVHQNWFGLMAVVKEMNQCTLPFVIDVIVEMAHRSGTFVHNKVLKEFWPLVQDYFMAQIHRSEPFDHTADFAMVTKIISTIPQIVAFSGLTEAEANESFLKIFTVSLQEQGQFAFYCRVQKRKTDNFYHRGIPIRVETI